MPTHKATLSQVIRDLEAKKRRIRDIFRETAADERKECLDLCILLSSGPYTREQLRQLGHPYSTRNPRPPAPTGIINVATDVFRRNWKAEGGSWRGDTLESRVVNRSKVAEWLKTGTRRMIARPLPEMVLQQLGDRRKRYEAALKKAMA